MGWRSLFTITLLLIAAVTTWSAWQGKDLVPLTELLAQRSDYVLHDFTLVSLNAEGEEAFTLSAPELQQTPNARTLEMTTPRFLIPQGETGRWQINADTGWVSANSDEVRLRGNVIAVPVGDASAKPRIETEALDVFPQQQLATSDADVTLTRPGATMRGTGMRAHLDQHRVELLSKVNIQHDPSFH